MEISGRPAITLRCLLVNSDLWVDSHGWDVGFQPKFTSKMAILSRDGRETNCMYGTHNKTGRGISRFSVETIGTLWKVSRTNPSASASLLQHVSKL